MECSVTPWPSRKIYRARMLANRSRVISCYLFDFALTFNARRSNLREHFQ